MPIPASREDLLNDLQGNQCRVVFKKKDDTLRTMICTLREDMLPSREAESLTKKPKNESVVPVWDIRKKAWRSFRLDSILDFNVLSEEETSSD
mgnify:CR=1 FL=1